MENSYTQYHMPETFYTPAKKPRVRDWEKDKDPEVIKEPSNPFTWIPYEIDEEELEEIIKRTPDIPN